MLPKKRPIHLNLFQIRFPAPAIVSILHRASGVILFLSIPLFLWLLSCSLQSQSSFDSIHTSLTHPVCAFITWAILSALLYHLIAGIRHLCMDIGIAESLQGGRCTAYLVYLTSAIGIILLGVWLW